MACSPFRNLIKKREERNSINKAGAAKYLRTIAGLRKMYPNVILIPGTESAPFYYWTGSPFTGSLTANDHERRILTMGLEKPEDYETLPILHNGLSGSHVRVVWPALAAFTLCFLIALFFLFKRGWWRMSGVVLAILSAGFFVNTFFARPSPFDAYHGKQGAAPYQLFIDSVGQRGGLTFWNYPETQSGVREMGPIHVRTLPYPGMLLETRNYTGFAALYGDTGTVTEPGNIWDVVLKEYCGGCRERPPWGIATADFHKEGDSGQNLGDFQTVLWLTGKDHPVRSGGPENRQDVRLSGKVPPNSPSRRILRLRCPSRIRPPGRFPEMNSCWRATRGSGFHCPAARPKAVPGRDGGERRGPGAADPLRVAHSDLQGDLAPGRSITRIPSRRREKRSITGWT